MQSSRCNRSHITVVLSKCYVYTVVLVSQFEHLAMEGSINYKWHALPTGFVLLWSGVFGYVLPGWLCALHVLAHFLLPQQSSLELGRPDISPRPPHTPAPSWIRHLQPGTNIFNHFLSFKKHVFKNEMYALKCVVISMLHLFDESNALHMEFFGFRQRQMKMLTS